MQDDDTPIYDVLFEMQMSLCERFPAYTPTALRRERAREVFLLIARLNRYSAKERQTSTGNVRNDDKVIVRPAGDTWF